MAKSVEQRVKDLVEPTTRTFLAKNWSAIASGFSKELNAPIFKKLGDIGPMAKRYDAAADTFIAGAKKKDEAKDLFADAAAKLGKCGSEIDGLKKELEDVYKDEKESLSVAKDPKTLEDVINFWDEQLKAQQDMNKDEEGGLRSVGESGRGVCAAAIGGDRQRQEGRSSGASRHGQQQQRDECARRPDPGGGDQLPEDSPRHGSEGHCRRGARLDRRLRALIPGRSTAGGAQD